MANSHYLEKDRLAHVIAAIQILGVSDLASATLNRWVAELESSEEMTPEQLDQTPVKFADRKKWATVFEQHPEFFKSYTLRGEPRVLLRWRYAQSFSANQKSGAKPKNGFSPAAGGADRPNDTEEFPIIVGEPLRAEQIQVLITTAMELHDRQAAAERKPERWPPMVQAGVAAALGTVVGGSAVVLLGWLQLTHVTRLFN